MSTLAWIVAIAGTALTVLALPLLLLAECSGRADLRRKVKPVASLGFLIAACAMAPWRGGFGAAPTWLALGLVLGAVGDVALMYEGERAFLAGLGAFLLGHALYVVGFAVEVPIGRWLDGPAPAIAVGVASLGALTWLWRHLGGMKAPVIAYVAVISAMVIGAVAIRATGGGGALRPTVALVAALLFYASDLAVARDQFVARRFINRAWGLPAYYAGQLLFAWSIA